MATNNRGMPIPPKVEEQVKPEEVTEASPVEQQPAPGPKKKEAVKVIALRPGFYKKRRLAKGQAFDLVPGDKLGDWMALADKQAELKRRLDEKKKKAAGR